MLSVLLLIIIICLAGWAILKFGVFDPTSLVAIIASSHAFFFYVTGVLEMRPHSVSRWWHYSFTVDTVAAEALGIYLAEIVVAILAGFAARPRQLLKPNVPGLTAQLQQSFSQRGVAFDIPLIILACILSSLTLVHALSVNWSELWYHTTYLSVRDASNVGIHNRLIGAFHTIAPQLGLAITALAAALFYSRMRTIAVIFGALAFYDFVLTAANSSRLSAAYLGVLALVIFTAGESRTIIRRRIIAVVLAGAGLIVYLSILALRTAGKGHDELIVGEFGLGPLCSFILAGEFLDADILFQFLISVFGSGFQLSDAMLKKGGLLYPMQYKFLSFLPTPSFLDGFAQVREEFMYQPLDTGGYSAFAESYLFGVPWLLLCFLLLFVMIRGMKMALPFLSAPIRAGATVILIAALAGLHTYPVRNSIRFVYLLIIVSYAARAFSGDIGPSAWKQKRGLNRSLVKQREPLSAHPAKRLGNGVKTTPPREQSKSQEPGQERRLDSG
jgi:hypothetical protein